MMRDYKSLLASRTFWGAAVAILAGILNYFGYDIAGQDQVALIDGVTTAVTVGGGLLAIVGRVTATKKIGL